LLAACLIAPATCRRDGSRLAAALAFDVSTDMGLVPGSSQSERAAS
jgi:hypothetical protein